MPYFAIASILTILGSTTTSDISIHIAGGETVSGVKAIIEGDLAFVSLDDISEKLGIESKDIGAGMIGLCKGDLCTPVDLNGKNDVRRDSGKLMINVNLIAQAMASEVRWIVPGRNLSFVPGNYAELDTFSELNERAGMLALPKTGDAVPNFSLPSVIDGKTVSFGSFRGKRVLLFLWASW